MQSQKINIAGKLKFHSVCQIDIRQLILNFLAPIKLSKHTHTHTNEMSGRRQWQKRLCNIDNSDYTCKQYKQTFCPIDQYSAILIHHALTAGCSGCQNYLETKRSQVLYRYAKTQRQSRLNRKERESTKFSTVTVAKDELTPGLPRRLTVQPSRFYRSEKRVVIDDDAVATRALKINRILRGEKITLVGDFRKRFKLFF